MNRADIERVFGRGRLQMVTGEHVEVFREEALPGERRRYTKRFLCTSEGDFRQWTEREWRILARLVGHGIGPVPDVVQFDRGANGRPALVQTYDAGITVDHWMTLLPVERDGRMLHHVFEDCAHWWALARHCLVALDAIHELHLVHLDLKPDNVCIPCVPADFDPAVRGQLLRPQFEQIALIDFAFSLVSGESLSTALPIGHQTDYDYQSPRLLHALESGRHGDLLPTRRLDWRCDIFSLAAMLRRCLPAPQHAGIGAWTSRRHADALVLVDRLYDAHNGHAGAQRPHGRFIEMASAALRDHGLSASLERGWCLALDVPTTGTASLTPITRIALPVAPRVKQSPVFVDRPAAQVPPRTAVHVPLPMAAAPRPAPRRLIAGAGVVAAAAASLALLGPGGSALLSDERGDEAQDDGVALAQVATAAPEPAASSPGADPASAPAAEAPAKSASPKPDAPALAAPRPARGAAGRKPEAPAKIAGGRPEPPAKVAAAGRKTPVTVTHPPVKVAAAAPAKATPLARAPWPRVAPAPASATAPVAATVPTPAPMPTVVAAAPAPAPAAPLQHDPAPGLVVMPHAPAAQFPAASLPPASQMPSANTPLPERFQPPAQVAIAPAAARASLFLPDDFGARADTLMGELLPRIAQRAERMVMRALHAAAQDEDGTSDADILDATLAMHVRPEAPLADIPLSSADARRLHEAAGTAFWTSRNPQQALALQFRAFGANPLDAEVAGNLAYYYLKQRPASPEAARRLALYALTMAGSPYPHGRLEDWTTYAVASALTGRERDARNAFFVTLALSPNLDRQCRAAASAYAAHGPALRGPTEAMLARIRTWGRSSESAFCRWPPNWWVGLRE
jgi:hypothetical protein